MKFDLIIFDCDGTLIDSEELNNQAVSNALIELGFEQYDLKYCLKNFTGMSFKDIFQKIQDENSKVITKSELGELVIKYSKENIYSIKAVKNAKNLLSQLNYPLAIASNGHKDFVIKYLENTSLINFFLRENIFTHDIVERPKPYPDLFLYAAKVNNINPKNIIVIEDSVAGVIAAKAAGMYSVGFIGSSFDQSSARLNLEKAGANVIISDLLQLLNHLN